MAADIDLYIPFIIRWETGVSLPGASNENLFDAARRSRNAFSDNALDRGGATMCGVTLATYRAYCGGIGQTQPAVADLRGIAYADWRAIVATMFWERWRASDIASQAVAEALVDWLWTSGTSGIKIPQRLLGVKADGIVGPMTLAAVARQEPAELFAALQSRREIYVHNIVASSPSQRVWLNGWLNRIRALTACHASSFGRCKS